MTADDIKALQAAAAAIAPGVAVITVETRQDVVYEPDQRKGFEGRNRLAKRSPCKTCNETPGTVIDGEGFPEACPDCDGLGFLETETRWPVDHISITLGHHTIEGFDVLDGDGRVDRRRARTIDEMTAMLKTAISNIAMNVLALNHSHPVPDARAAKLAAIAIAAGVVPEATTRALLAARLAHGAPKALGKTAATMLAVVCSSCNARTTSENQKELRDRFQPDLAKPPACPACGSTALAFSLVTRDDAGVESSQPVS